MRAANTCLNFNWCKFVMESVPDQVRITVEAELMPWLADASARFRYLHPEVDVTIEGLAVVLSGSGVREPALAQDFWHCLYRQKIFSETLPLRKMLIEGVTGFVSRTT
ncbi:hypothetical protein [Sinorhizobium terangae]|uniref:hypothetical protein n=1 Tax=Sinorhizobium terangae TaxID=110322 RepID=UPI0024B14EFD|nr:hypothetical protein [Sinorhizobium terangae]WFU50732.1 hypothetical protein QA637_19015 [Sinorhizobium terangae]